MSKQPERRRRVVRAFAPAVGLLAAGLLVWQGSYAAFSANTDNGASSWGTGNLTLQNDGGVTGGWATSTTAIFGGTNLKPGAPATSVCLTVQAGGSLGGSLGMYVTGVTDDASGALTNQIQLTVDEAPVTSEVPKNCAGFPAAGDPSITNVSNAVALSAFPASYATAAAPETIAAGGGMVAYRVSWQFVDGANDNTLMNKTASATFNWELQ